MGMTGAEIYVSDRGRPPEGLVEEVAAAVGESGREVLPFTRTAVVVQVEDSGWVAVAVDEAEPVDAGPLSARLPGALVVRTFTLDGVQSIVTAYRDGKQVGEEAFGLEFGDTPDVRTIADKWGVDLSGSRAPGDGRSEGAGWDTFGVGQLLGGLGLPVDAVGIHAADFAHGLDAPDWARKVVRVTF